MIKIPLTGGGTYFSHAECVGIGNNLIMMQAAAENNLRQCEKLMQLNEALALALDSIECMCFGEPPNLCQKCLAVSAVASVISEHNMDGAM